MYKEEALRRKTLTEHVEREMTPSVQRAERTFRVIRTEPGRISNAGASWHQVQPKGLTLTGKVRLSSK
jgi:hypothetical protein